MDEKGNEKKTTALCKDCAYYYGDGLCRSKMNKKGYTSALDSRPCFANKVDFPEPVAWKKTCKVCGNSYPLSEFPTHPKSKDGHTNTCKKCNTAARKAGAKKRNPIPEADATQLEQPKKLRILHVTYKGDIEKAMVKGLPKEVQKAALKDGLVASAKKAIEEDERLRKAEDGVREMMRKEAQRLLDEKAQKMKEEEDRQAAEKAKFSIMLSQAPTKILLDELRARGWHGHLERKEEIEV